MKMQRTQTDCSDNEYEYYTYLYDLIEVEKRNPELQEYNSEEEVYRLLKKIAISSIKSHLMRFQLVSLLEEKFK